MRERWGVVREEKEGGRWREEVGEGGDEVREEQERGGRNM